jgi:hypothetical protein
VYVGIWFYDSWLFFPLWNCVCLDVHLSFLCNII